MNIKLKLSKLFEKYFYLFPFRLVIVHIRDNTILMGIWLFIIAMITGRIGDSFGVQHLFLNPEYLGKVSVWSFLIVGFSAGGIIMAFNISSYIVNGYKFPFIATISRPFVKYCLNNAIIPLVFIISYLREIYIYQVHQQETTKVIVWYFIAAVSLGIFFFIFITLTYFLTTNKDIFSLFGLKKLKQLSNKKYIKSPIGDFLHKKNSWNERYFDKIQPKVSAYFSLDFRIKTARDSSHYNWQMLDMVFRQNHLNAAFFQVSVFISIILLGFFREKEMFLIPAGATIFLFLTMLVMIVSALNSWFKGWTFLIILFAILGFNELSKYEKFKFKSYAYGIDNTKKGTKYNNQTLNEHVNDIEQVSKDRAATIEILNNWKKKVTPKKWTRKKPKLVMIAASGGGMRAALWTYFVLQNADSITNGKLLKHTQFMSGSSGGMIGLSYLRELYLQSQEDSAINIYKKTYYDKLAKDLLNPVAYNIAVNDLFVRLQTFEDDYSSMVKDRAYAFEYQLNKNTDYAFTKRLKDYQEPEKSAKIPLMFITTSIINDGRRLLISPQGTSYMVYNYPENNVYNQALPDLIEYKRFFKNHDPLNMKFSSALRMNATFPYILPVVSLPSEPEIEVLDAGARDNYGMSNVIKYLFNFREWIANNTDGVIIIQTRDRYKEIEATENVDNTMLNSLISPAGSVYSNFDQVHNFTHDQMLQYASGWFKGNIHVVDFQLKNDQTDKISMSFHLTSKEREKVIKALEMPENIEALRKIKSLLE